MMNTESIYAQLSCHAPQQAQVSAPGSKSETNRALLLASLCQCVTELRHCLISEDTEVMIKSLKQLGVEFQHLEKDDAIIVNGKATFDRPLKTLFIGNSGTTARFLTAACCLANQAITIDGNSDMRKRPIGPLVDALQSIGFNVKAANDMYVPVSIYRQENVSLKSHVVVDSSASSQFVSALMMIAPKLEKGLTIELANPNHTDGSGYLDITIELMKAFGITIASPRFGFWTISPAKLQCKTTYYIEADYSACTYFWAAEKLSGHPVHITNCHLDLDNSSQPDAKAFDIISTFPNLPGEIDGSLIQDAIPTLAVMAAFNHTPVRFTGIKNLRVKECDRIEALHEGLNRVQSGLAQIEENDLIVRGSPALQGKTAFIRTFNDHRIAMSFALMAFRLGGITIENPYCVRKTFPDYWRQLKKLGVQQKFVTELNEVKPA